MQIGSALLSTFGVAPASYMPSKSLPPVESMRPDPSPRPRKDRVSGTGTIISSGVIFDTDLNSETSGAKWYGQLGKQGVVGTMLRDPHVRQSVGYATNPPRAATWRFRPASKSAIDREAADFATWAFTQRLQWDKIVERGIGGPVEDGFKLFEMLDDMRPVPADRFPLHPGKGVGLLPIALHDIPANTVYRWHPKPGNPSELESIDQWQPTSDTQDQGIIRIKADRLIRITANQVGGNFAGIADLRSAYGAWKLKNAFQRWQAIGFERTSVGTPIAIASDNTPDGELDDVNTILENMRVMAKGSAVLPFGYTFSWEGAGENDNNNLGIAIEQCNTDIAINVCAGFTRLGLVGPGSYALGSTQEGQYHLSIVGRVLMFANAINIGNDGWSPVERIIRENYGPSVGIPVLEARHLPTRDYSKVIATLVSAVSSQIVTPDDPLEDEIREALQLGPRDPETSRGGRAPLAVVPDPVAESDAPQASEELADVDQGPLEEDTTDDQ